MTSLQERGRRGSATLAKAASIAVPTILLIVGGLYFVAYLATSVVGLPVTLGLPAALRAVGAVLAVVGFAFGGGSSGTALRRP